MSGSYKLVARTSRPEGSTVFIGDVVVRGKEFVVAAGHVLPAIGERRMSELWAILESDLQGLLPVRLADYGAYVVMNHSGNRVWLLQKGCQTTHRSDVIQRLLILSADVRAQTGVLPRWRTCGNCQTPFRCDSDFHGES